jgi:WD40 repeat protein
MNRALRSICLSFGGVVIATLAVSYLSAAPKFSEWSVPVNLGPINSAFDEAGPAISKDDSSLYFQSTRPGGSGNADIYVSERERADDPWGAPTNLGPNVNSGFNDVVPNISRDGHYLFFASDRPGGSGNLDLWVSWREDKHNNLGWQPAVNLGALVNTASVDAGPSYFEKGEAEVPQLFFPATARVGTEVWTSSSVSKTRTARLVRPYPSPSSTVRSRTRRRKSGTMDARCSFKQTARGRRALLIYGSRRAGPYGTPGPLRRTWARSSTPSLTTGNQASPRMAAASTSSRIGLEAPVVPIST